MAGEGSVRAVSIEMQYWCSVPENSLFDTCCRNLGSRQGPPARERIAPRTHLTEYGTTPVEVATNVRLISLRIPIIWQQCRLLGYKNPFHTSQETHYVSTTETSQLMLCKIWGFHGGDYEECRLLGYKNTVRTSQETQYVSTTETSQLMLCKIWGFHGHDYEECRLLGYKTPVRTSQETHYVSTTETSQLMLCKIFGFQCCNCEECRLLWCGTEKYIASNIKDLQLLVIANVVPSSLILCASVASYC
jgi:hypothetical protein